MSRGALIFVVLLVLPACSKRAGHATAIDAGPESPAMAIDRIVRLEIAMARPPSPCGVPEDVFLIPDAEGIPLRVEAFRGSGAAEDVSGRVTWSVSDARVASIDSEGVIRGNSPGHNHVRASIGTVNEGIMVTVSDAESCVESEDGGATRMMLTSIPATGDCIRSYTVLVDDAGDMSTEGAWAYLDGRLTISWRKQIYRLDRTSTGFVGGATSSAPMIAGFGPQRFSEEKLPVPPQQPVSLRSVKCPASLSAARATLERDTVGQH
jgi:hypothetical protein